MLLEFIDVAQTSYAESFDGAIRIVQAPSGVSVWSRRGTSNRVDIPRMNRAKQRRLHTGV